MKLMVKDYITKKEMQDILAKAPKGVRPEVILRGLVDAGKVIEGYNEEQMGRNRPMEIISGLGKSAASFMPRTVGVTAPSLSKAADSNFAQFLPGPAGDVLRSIKKTKPISKPLLERLGKKGTELADKGEEAVTKFMGSTGVRQDTGFAKGGKLGGDIVQSVVGGPRGANFPGIKAITQAGVKEGSKMFAKYAAPRAAIGVGEELKYNIGTEGSLTRDDGTADMIIGPLAEIILPPVFDEIASKYLTKSAKNFTKIVQPTVSNTKMSDDIVKQASKITQAADPQDAIKQTRALANFDSRKLKKSDNVYRDLLVMTNDKIQAYVNAVDELAKTTGPKPLSEFTVYVGKDGASLKPKMGAMKRNYIEEALPQLEELFKEIDDVKKLLEVQELRAKDVLSPKDINDVSRLFPSTKQLNAYTQSGNLKVSKIANRAESLRKGLKDTARLHAGGAGDVMKEIDSRLSDLFSLKDQLQKNVKAVNRIRNKTVPRTVGEKIGRFLSNIMDVMTGGGWRGFITGSLKGNLGNKVLNWLDVEKAVVKHMKLLESMQDYKTIKNFTAVDDLVKYLSEQSGLPQKHIKKMGKMPISLDGAKKVSNKVAPDNFQPPKVGTQSSNNPMQVRGIPGAVDNVSDDLFKEARKYKSADEIVDKLIEGDEKITVLEKGLDKYRGKDMKKFTELADIIDTERRKVFNESGMSDLIEIEEKLLREYQDKKAAGVIGEELRQQYRELQEVRKVIREVQDLKSKLRKERLLNASAARDLELRKVDPSVDMLGEEDLSTLRTIAKKHREFHLFRNQIRGSATQYGEYTPHLRKYVQPQSKKLGDIEGLDPNTTITVYRGLDVKNVGNKGIKKGDFVTTDYQDALGYTDSPSKVVSKNVKLKNLIEESIESVDITDPKNPISYELIYYPGDDYIKVTDTQLRQIREQANK